MKTFLFIFVFTILTIPNMAQPQADTDSLYHKVRGFGTGLPQEKVYLHMDNTCYFLGDTIWYKGYVVRAGDQHTLTDLSRILYVELLTPDGYLVERQQLEMPGGTAHGAFVLTDSLYAGYYELRAYTRWMLNFGQCEYPHIPFTEKAFYSKRMAKEFFRDYDKLYSRVFPVYDKPEVSGRYAKDMTVRPLRRYFKKQKKKKPELRPGFYPEGGHLVQGTDCRVALELNDEEGRHLANMDIAIVDKDGNEMAVCRTDERGRAAFTLYNIDEEGGYRASFSFDGYEYEENLPEVEKTGCALAVTLTDTTAEARVQVVGIRSKLALHAMCRGVSHFYLPLDTTATQLVSIPLDSLPTGVNQLTLFDSKGRIHADRLFFVNHHDHDKPLLDISGIRPQYEPFDSIVLHLQLADTARAEVSLAVRDRVTEETGYDNGTILTEMLLASELKGFVENPGYYFEADDSIRRQALDLLMMVQGWRRYEWREMAGAEPFKLRWKPEWRQEITGSVHHTYTLYEENEPGEMSYITTLMKDLDLPIDFNTTENCGPDYRGKSMQHLYGPFISPMGKEVNVLATFTQGEETMHQLSKTRKGTFTLPTPKLHGNFVLELTATEKEDNTQALNDKYSTGFNDETAEPAYYVKLDLFFPVFPKPYSFYQDATLNHLPTATGHPGDTLSFYNRILPAIPIHARHSGLRKLDRDKPAIVIDAYEAFNLAADYGLNGGQHDWRTFSQQVAVATVGDMGMDRRYFIQERYDGKPQNLKINKGINLSKTQTTGDNVQEMPAYSISGHTIKQYRRLRNLDKIYIYTDYAPREQKRWMYAQDNQPEVIIDYRLFPDEGYQRTYRDRHYLLRGYAVCEDFYSPDYSRRPLPDTKDYRRTLLWLPRVAFDEKGQATVRLFNNAKPTVLGIEAEGITADGRFIHYKNGLFTESVSKPARRNCSAL